MDTSIDAYENYQLITEALEGTRGIDQQAIAIAGLELVALLLRKNQDYGSSVFKTPILCPNLSAGEAIKIRMSDKIERIIQLSGTTAQVESESRSDSIHDLAGYIILDKSITVKKRLEDPQDPPPYK